MNRSSIFAISLAFASTAIVLASTSAIPSPAGSRGEQHFPFGYDECMARANRAYQVEGWSSIGAGGAYVNAFKGPHISYITCNQENPGQVVVNIFVATEGTNDSGQPGAERVRLQQRMNESATATSGSGIQIVSATYGGNCSVPHGNVTSHIATACNGKNTCSYVVDYTVIGDPAYGCQKDYVAEYTCGSETKTVNAPPEAGFGAKLELHC